MCMYAYVFHNSDTAKLNRVFGQDAPRSSAKLPKLCPTTVVSSFMFMLKLLCCFGRLLVYYLLVLEEIPLSLFFKTK